MKDTQRRSTNWQASSREDLEGHRKWRLEPTRQKPLSPAMKRTVGRYATTRKHSHSLMGDFASAPLIFENLRDTGPEQCRSIGRSVECSVIVQLWA